MRLCLKKLQHKLALDCTDCPGQTAPPQPMWPVHCSLPAHLAWFVHCSHTLRTCMRRQRGLGAESKVQEARLLRWGYWQQCGWQAELTLVLPSRRTYWKPLWRMKPSSRSSTYNTAATGHQHEMKCTYSTYSVKSNGAWHTSTLARKSTFHLALFSSQQQLFPSLPLLQDLPLLWFMVAWY